MENPVNSHVNIAFQGRFTSEKDKTLDRKSFQATKTFLKVDSKKVSIGKVEWFSLISPSYSKMSLYSTPIILNAFGNFKDIREIITISKKTLNHIFLPQKTQRSSNKKKLTLDISTKSGMKDIFSIFASSGNLGNFLKLKLKSEYDSVFQEALFFAETDAFKWEKNTFEGVTISAKRESNILDFKSNIEEITFDSINNTVIQRLAISAKTKNGKESIHASIDTVISKNPLKDVELKGALQKTKDEYVLQILPSSLFTNSGKWNFLFTVHVPNSISAPTLLKFDSKGPKGERLRINYFPKSTDIFFAIDVKEYDIKYLNPFLKPFRTSVSGMLNGSVRLGIKEQSKKHLLSISELTLNNVLLGNLKFTFDNFRQGKYPFLAQIKNKKNDIQIQGNILGNTLNTFINGKIKSLEAKILNPYFNNVIAVNTGSISGNISATIKNKKFDYFGKATVKKVSGEVLDFGSLFEVSSIKPFVLKKPKIDFGELKLLSGNKEGGNISGGISILPKGKYTLNLALNFDNQEALNTTSSDFGLFGKVFASGNILLFSKNKDTHFTINAKTIGNSEIFFDILKSDGKSGNSILKFKKSVLSENQFPKLASNYDVNMNLDIDPKTKVTIYLDGRNGDKLVANGNGDFRIQYSKNGTLRWFGNYTITKGFYNLRLKGLLNKNFKITKGSSIEWDGDVYEGIADITGSYNLRTSLRPLFLPTADSIQRVDVECITGISSRLEKPEIRFSYNVKNVLEETKTYVNPAFQTPENVNNTFLSLLMFGRFPVRANAEVKSNSDDNNLLQGSYSLLVSQLNNVLNNSSLGFNLGVDYQVEDEKYRDEFILEISKELFDKRVSLDTRVGFGGDNKQDQTDSKVKSDVSLNLKGNKKGNLNFNIYNKSQENKNYDDLNDGDYEQGVGVSYGIDFDGIKDLLKKDTSETKGNRINH